MKSFFFISIIFARIITILVAYTVNIITDFIVIILILILLFLFSPASLNLNYHICYYFYHKFIPSCE